MEIATREIDTTITICYNDGCIKKINILKYYVGEEKTPVYNWKMVEYKHPDGAIDKDRSYTNSGLIDESDEPDAEKYISNDEIEKVLLAEHNEIKTYSIHKMVSIV